MSPCEARFPIDLWGFHFAQLPSWPARPLRPPFLLLGLVWGAVKTRHALPCRDDSDGSLGSQPALVLAATKSRTERHKSQRVPTGGAQRPLRSRAQRSHLPSHRLCLALRLRQRSAFAVTRWPPSSGPLHGWSF